MDVDKKINSLNEISKSKLSKILNLTPGPKDLVLEPILIKPLERICGVKWLKNNEVDKIFKLDTSHPKSNSPAIFYMIFCNTTTFNKVVEQIRSALDPENPIKNKYNIIVVPKSLFVYEELLEQHGLIDTNIKLHSFQWQPLNLDGTLSLELPQIYKQVYIYQDYTLLPIVAKSLWYLLFVVGKPKMIVSLGQISNVVLRQLDLFCEDIAEDDKMGSDFGSLVVMDRSVDYPSALLTPGTYSALLKEVYGVYCGICEFKEADKKEYDNKFNPVKKKSGLLTFSLDSKSDTVYSEIKNRYFTEVTSVLSNMIKEIRNESASSKEMALDEMKRYIQTQLHATKAKKAFISNHLSAAETIINEIGPRYETQKEIESNIMRNKSKSGNLSCLEEILVTENDELSSLRLFCLLSLSQKLSETEIRNFWRKYLHEFGYKNIFAYENLLTTGFIPDFPNSTKILKLPKFDRNNFYTNVNKMKQVPTDPEKISLKYPTCSSYVFGGIYIPLITQIASLLLNTSPLDEIKSKLESFGPLTVRNERGYPLQPRSVLIYIVGGVTYAEIAACNLLEVLTGAKIVLFSDRIVSGNDLMKALLSLPNE